MIGDQLLRASTSISANIAEGHGSYRGKEYGKFLSYALRSAYETENWLLKLHDSPILRQHVDVETVQAIARLNTEIIKMLVTLSKKIDHFRTYARIWLTGDNVGMLQLCTQVYCPREGIAVLETGRLSSDKG
jgi:four helix bundle protein